MARSFATIGRSSASSCIPRTPTARCSACCGLDCWTSAQSARDAFRSRRCPRRRTPPRRRPAGNAWWSSRSGHGRPTMIVREPGTAGFFTLTQESSRPDRAIPAPSIRCPRSRARASYPLLCENRRRRAPASWTKAARPSPCCSAGRDRRGRPRSNRVVDWRARGGQRRSLPARQGHVPLRPLCLQTHDRGMPAVGPRFGVCIACRPRSGFQGRGAKPSSPLNVSIDLDQRRGWP
jgi:hypothetical protein